MLRVTRIGEVVRYDLARTLAGRGRYWTTCYRVGDTMVDSGCAHTRGELLTELGATPVRRLITTHTHEDHIGAHGALARSRPELEVHAHALALPVLADPAGRQPLHPYRRVMWGWPEPSPATAVDDGEEIPAGPFRFRVLHTPGHSPEHLCFSEPDRGWVFTGDLYVGGRDRALRAGYDIWEIIASLDRIADLRPTLLLPGSARIPEQPGEALRAKLEHLLELGEKVLELDRRGASETEIVRRYCGPPMAIEWLTLGHFSRRNLVRSYLGRNHDPSERRWTGSPPPS